MPYDLILRTCRALFAPTQVVELRAIGLGGREGHSAAGWFDNFDALAKAALAAEERQRPEGIYVTLNELHPGCLARSASNKLVPAMKGTTGDKDIVRRTWLPIDLDPTRPSKISSSDEELERARTIAGRILNFLEKNLRFPAGLRAFSSNGLHLLYRIDIANDDDSKCLIQRCLNALHEKYSNDHVTVDTSVFNAARIWKLWGTFSRKGSHLPGRPHRRSMLWPWTADDEGSLPYFPAFDEIPVVPAEKIAELAALAAYQPGRKKQVGKKRGPKDIDVEAFIKQHNIAVAEDKPYDNGGHIWILESCLFDSSHVGTSATLGKAATGAVFYKCQHSSCSGRRWSDVKALFDERPGATATKVAPSIAATTENPWDLARDFLKASYEDQNGDITLRCYRENFYVYEPRLFSYRPVSERAIRNEITCWLSEFAEKITRGVVADILHCVEANVTVRREDFDLPVWAEIKLGDVQPIVKIDPAPRRWLCLKNGIFDVDAMLENKPAEECMREGTPNWFNIVALDYEFVPDAECPRWLAFMNHIMESDAERIAVIQEMFGYCFWQTAKLEKFFICIGGGSNGKSTALKILEELLGTANVSSLTPNEMDDKFLRLALWGKLANLCLDMDEVDRVSEGLFKKITSGDRIVGDRKFRNYLEWHPTAKLIFATNTMPRFVDVTQGIWRRAMVIPFDVTISADKQDPDLFHKLKTELPGIFLWAMAGMIRLMKTKRFTDALACTRAQREEKRKALPVLAFIEDECVYGPEETGVIRTIWMAYKKWCAENGLTKPKPLIPFSKDMRSLRPELRDGKITKDFSERVRVVLGINLRPDHEYLRQLPPS